MSAASEVPMTAATPSPTVANGSVATQRPSPASGNAGEGRGPEELVALLRRAIADPGQFCARERWPDASGITGAWLYESIQAWGARAAAIALADAGLLLPPGGETREEGGYILGSGRISAAGWSSASPTRRRTVTVWPIEGEPNDNWPRYTGPWIEVTDD